MFQDFHQIASPAESGRTDKLFRAAISAFCALTRPTRRDIIQIEELCLQLYDTVSADALRYGSAVLSECAHAPAALVRRLADEPIEIAAPLLLKSDALAEIDLIAIIGHHGASHARVIAQRCALSHDVTRVVDRVAPDVPLKSDKAEKVRQALRRMMRPADLPRTTASGEETVYARLRATALSGSPDFFHAALADTLGITPAQAQALVSASDRQPFFCILKALGLSAEQAFMLVAALGPARFPHPAAIRAFDESYELIPLNKAVEALRLFQADAVFSAMAENGNARPLPVPAAAAVA